MFVCVCATTTHRDSQSREPSVRVFVDDNFASASSRFLCGPRREHRALTALRYELSCAIRQRASVCVCATVATVVIERRAHVRRPGLTATSHSVRTHRHRQRRLLWRRQPRDFGPLSVILDNTHALAEIVAYRVVASSWLIAHPIPIV